MKSRRRSIPKRTLLLLGWIVFLLGTPSLQVWAQGLRTVATSQVQARTTGLQDLRKASTGTWRVLEATRVWIDGKHEPLVTGTQVATGTTLRLETKSRMHLLLGKDLLLSAVGAGRIVLASPRAPRHIRVLRASIVQLSGRAGSLEVNGRKIVLSPPGATALVKGNQLYVRRGTVQLRRKSVHPSYASATGDLAPPATSGATTSGATTSGATTSGATTSGATTSGATTSGATTSGATTSGATTSKTGQGPQVQRLGRGDSLRLSRVGDLPIETFQAVPRAALREISRYRAPAPWKPKHTRSLQRVLKRVRRLAKRQAAADRGSVSQSLDGPASQAGRHLYGGINATPTLEGRNATLGVRVRGIPHAPRAEAGK